MFCLFLLSSLPVFSLRLFSPPSSSPCVSCHSCLDFISSITSSWALAILPSLYTLAPFLLTFPLLCSFLPSFFPFCLPSLWMYLHDGLRGAWSVCVGFLLFWSRLRYSLKKKSPLQCRKWKKNPAGIEKKRFRCRVSQRQLREYLKKLLSNGFSPSCMNSARIHEYFFHAKPFKSFLSRIVWFLKICICEWEKMRIRRRLFLSRMRMTDSLLLEAEKKMFQ